MRSEKELQEDARKKKKCLHTETDCGQLFIRRSICAVCMTGGCSFCGKEAV